MHKMTQRPPPSQPIDSDKQNRKEPRAAGRHPGLLEPGPKLHMTGQTHMALPPLTSHNQDDPQSPPTEELNRPRGGKMPPQPGHSTTPDGERSASHLGPSNSLQTLRTLYTETYVTPLSSNILIDRFRDPPPPLPPHQAVLRLVPAQGHTHTLRNGLSDVS